MAPSLLVKAAFVRGDFDPVSNCIPNVRTEYMLKNTFAYLIKDGFKYETVTAENKTEERVLRDLIEVMDSFKLSYSDAIKNLCSELEVTADTVRTVLLGVSSELFCEGITWSRIISWLVFVGELALQCLYMKMSPTVVEVIYVCYSRYLKEYLKAWIDDHGGWEAIRTLTKSQQDRSNEPLNEEPQSSNQGWAKSLLHGTVRMIGTLAHIANSSGQPFA